MAKHKPYTIALTESDLDFVVKTISPGIKNKDKLKQFIESDPDFRKSVLADEKLFQKITDSNSVFLSISTILFFEILLRQTVKELSEATHC
ncbi:MAG: hypothetical protein ABH805_01375 [Candidatus Nealsonbacteria bacterium]